MAKDVSFRAMGTNPSAMDMLMEALRDARLSLAFRRSGALKSCPGWIASREGGRAEAIVSAIEDVVAGATETGATDAGATETGATKAGATEAGATALEQLASGRELSAFKLA